MLAIKFSHNYPKLWGQEKAELLAIKEIKIDKNTPIDLIEYDTMYINRREGENGAVEEAGYFTLKSGNYIQLIFLGNKGIPFCTIRTASPQSKVDYYKSNIGKIFEIRIKDLK